MAVVWSMDGSLVDRLKIERKRVMTNKEKLEAIRAEIERLMYAYNLEEYISSAEDSIGEKVAAGKYDVCEHLLSFIDSTQEEPVSEDLGEYINELSKQFPEVSFAKLSRIAVRVAKWYKEKDFQYLKKECERTGSCCDNDIAIEATKRHPYYYASEMEAYANIGFKEGAWWQKEQDQSTIELAEDHAMFAGMEKMKEEIMAKAVDVTVHIDAGGYPYTPEIELYDYDNDVPLAKEGDKYKVVLIKED